MNSKENHASLARSPEGESSISTKAVRSKVGWMQAGNHSDFLVLIGLFLFGFLVSFWTVDRSGEVWLNDGARYLNNGAMVRDWIDSGRWLDPAGFARENYFQFPAHNVPYHPPGYALMLGVWFKVFGLSYAAARGFIAVCLGLSLLAMRQIVLALGGSRGSAALTALVFGSIPQVVIWSRTCMSEFPGMVFILWGTCFFLMGLRSENRTWQAANSLLAIGFAMIAFMCRISTAGVLPVWYLYLLKTKGFRESFRAKYILPAVAYLMFGIAWVKFAAQYSKNEMRSSLLQSLSGCLSYENLMVWWVELPAMVSATVFCLALLGFVAGWFRKDDRNSAWFFWVVWIACYYLFQVAQNLPFEARYFIYALPAVVGLVSILFALVPSRPSVLYGCSWIAVTVVLWNLWMSQFYYPGLIGYQSVAEIIGDRTEKGNVMITSYADADLIFRLRCEETTQLMERQIIRGDRVLAIRNPAYSKAPTTILAKTNSDVYEALSKGRVRFVVTEGPSSDGNWVNEEQEVRLCHQAMVENPMDYELVAVRPLKSEFVEVPIHIWMYRHELQEGKSTLPVVIPTAGIEMK